MVYDKYTEKAIDKAVQHLRKKDELEVRQARPALIKITNSWLANQKRHNYINLGTFWKRSMKNLIESKLKAYQIQPRLNKKFIFKTKFRNLTTNKLISKM